MPLQHLHTTGVDNDPNCECEQCLPPSPTKKPRRVMTFLPSSPESQPIVKGNNKYGAKGTIRCLACQRRKGKCEFPADKPELPCEHCKRRGLRCGDKLPTERKRLLNQSSQDEHSFVRSMDSSWPNTPVTTPTTNTHPQCRYTEEPRQYTTYMNGVAPRPVAPALPPPLPEPRPTMNYTPRPYHPVPPQSIPRPTSLPFLPLGSDLVRLIETQIAKISLSEVFAVARCLSSEHGLIGNPYISGVMIARKNQEFSRGDSWFNVQWLESDSRHHGSIARSVNLRFEPGRQICTSYSVDDSVTHQQHFPPPAPAPPPPPPAPPPQHSYQSQPPSRQNTQPEIITRVESPMEIDPPKATVNWSGLVGDLFVKAAGIVDDQGRVKSEASNEFFSAFPEAESTALWPKWAWNAIRTIIWGQEASKSTKYTIGIPHLNVEVVVERCKSIVDVFWFPQETEPVESPQFIKHPLRKRISLKTLARVLSHFSKARKPRSAGESMQQIEDLVETDSTTDFASNPLKRRFDEINSDHTVKVKTERSISRESSWSQATSNSSLPVKMEIDQTSAVDEETSNAASILNGVSKDLRTTNTVPPPIQTYPYWSQDEKGHISQAYRDPPNTQWLYASQQASLH